MTCLKQRESRKATVVPKPVPEHNALMGPLNSDEINIVNIHLLLEASIPSHGVATQYRVSSYTIQQLG